MKTRMLFVAMLIACVSVLVAQATTNNHYFENARANSLPGKELKMKEMQKYIGGCPSYGPACLPAGQVCGFGAESAGPTYLTDCCSYLACTPNPVVVYWSCSVNKTNRKTCQGSFSPPPGCSYPSSINCGSGSVCLVPNTTCNGCECVLTGVTVCGGVPYITGCGSFATCG